jgi:hypothetical protein
VGEKENYAEEGAFFCCSIPLSFMSTEAKERYMRIDAYTKTMLTIIALCLMWICVRDLPLLSNAQAQSSAQEVKIVGVDIGGEQMLPIALRQIYVKNPFDAQLSLPVDWVPIGGKVTTLEAH